MTEKKPVKKPAAATRVKKAAPAAAKPAAKAGAAAQKKPAPVKPLASELRREAKPVRHVPPPAPMRKVVGPMARTCPLVLDGEVDALDFSERDCLTCGEFDCKFCESQNGSGSLKSRLFAGSDDGDDGGDDDLDPDLDFGEGEESLDGEEVEGEGEEEF